MQQQQTPISRDHNKKLVKIIQTLLAYEQSIIFRKPFPHKALFWNDYRDMITKPIDLNLVRRQYNQGKYNYVEEVLNDIQTIWSNVFLYDRRDHQSYEPAQKMNKYFSDLVDEYFPQFKDRIVKFQLLGKNKSKPIINSKVNEEKNKQPPAIMSKSISIKQKQVQQNDSNSNKNKDSNPKLKKKLSQPDIKQVAKSIIAQKQVQLKQKSVELQNNELIEQQQQSNQSGHLAPILVNLKQNPTIQEISQISDMMKQLTKLEQFQTLSKIVKILTKYEKENMIIDGQQVKFRMNQIHISTYWRIRKQLQIRIASSKLNGKFINLKNPQPTSVFY